MSLPADRSHAAELTLNAVLVRDCFRVGDDPFLCPHHPLNPTRFGQLAEMSRQHYVSPCWMAVAYTGIGERNAALDALDKAYKQHDVMLVWLWTDPHFDPLRAKPRFNDLLQHIGLPPGAGDASRGA